MKRSDSCEPREGSEIRDQEIGEEVDDEAFPRSPLSQAQIWLTSSPRSALGYIKQGTRMCGILYIYIGQLDDYLYAYIMSRAGADKTCLMIGRAFKIVFDKYVEYIQNLESLSMFRNFKI